VRAADSVRPIAAPSLTGVERHTLDNGLRVLLRRDVSAPVTAVVTHVNAGYFDETDDVVGIAHVLEHMYFKGTPTRGVGEIARQTKAVGGYLNAATIYDHTLYYAVVPSNGFDAALAIQADAYRRSLIDAGELASELQVIIQEARRKEDNPPAVAIESLYALLHDRHRIRRWRIGREAGLRTFTRDHVLGFYRNFYRPSTTILVVVGDVDTGHALRAIERLYGDLPAGEPRRTPGDSEVAPPAFRYCETAGDIAQTQFAFGWRTVGPLHADTPALEMLAGVLATGRASRLYRATRERRLVSSIAAFHYTPRDIGVFAVQAEAPPDKAAAAIGAAWDQIRRVRDEGIRADELERARCITESRWVRRLEDMEGQANHLAEWEALGRWELGDELLQRMLDVSVSDVRDVAGRYLRDATVGLFTYRPAASAPLFESAELARTGLQRAAAEPLAPGAAQTAVASARRSRPAFEREGDGVRVYRLGSGVPVLVRRRPASPITYLGVFALGGACEETDAIGGRTLLMARSALKGTTTRDAVQIAEAGELMGGSVGASVGSEMVGWSISVPARHAAAAMALLADVALRPAFAAEAIDTERAIALANLAALRDDMYRHPMRLAARAAFAGHPYGVPSLGSEESLQTHDARGLTEWHRSRFLDGPSVVACVGPDDPDELAALAATHFEALRFRLPTPIAAPVWPASVVQSAEQRAKAQTALMLSWQAPARTDPDRFDVALLCGIASGLGGRLFEELRDKQSLCYTVQAFASERRAVGTFHTYIATSPDKEQVARDGLLAELAKFRETLVTADELARAQTYAIGTNAISKQSGAVLLGEMVDAWLFGSLRELPDYDRRVRAVTAEGIRAAARRYLDPDRRVEGIVRGATTPG
jgi:zinc protease